MSVVKKLKGTKTVVEFDSLTSGTVLETSKDTVCWSKGMYITCLTPYTSDKWEDLPSSNEFEGFRSMVDDWLTRNRPTVVDCTVAKDSITLRYKF